jgi:DNA-binding phage protein
MSKSIDERVVQMTFDNKAFEKNVGTSLNTLQKLKSALTFKKSTKSLSEFNKAANNTSLNGLSKGIDAISNKFSVMGIVGITAIQNITNSALNAGKKIASALTIDPVKAGFEEYEIKMNAIKTILSNTKKKGTSLDDINDALQDLNDYSDLTVYNFAQMTDMVGKFSAKTGDLESSVSIVKGMANLAAEAGVGNQELQNTLYQMSQISEKVTLRVLRFVIGTALIIAGIASSVAS